MRPLPVIKEGDAITADWAERIREAIMEGQIVPMPPLFTLPMPGGTVLGIAGETTGVVIKTTGAASGGTYPAKFQTWNPANSTWVDGANCEVILL